MENKKASGAYTCRCRKELRLTQREFVDRLFAIESAVSKWKRGMSYPDITPIRDICTILQVPEHELLIVSEDVEARTAETLVKKHLSLLRRLCRIQYIPYDGTALICPICNPTVGHTLDWFWLVLTGELVEANLIFLPILVKQYRGVITLGGLTLSLELLLLATCPFSEGDQFPLALAEVLPGLGAAFLPGALQELPRFLGEHKTVLHLGTETLLLCALLWVSCAYDGVDWFPIPTPLAVFSGLILPWAWVLICRYASISHWWRGTACLGAACVFLPLVNPVIDRLVRLGSGMVEWFHGFWFRPDFIRWAENWYFNESALPFLWLTLVATAALCVFRMLLRRREARAHPDWIRE